MPLKLSTPLALEPMTVPLLIVTLGDVCRSSRGAAKATETNERSTRNLNIVTSTVGIKYLVRPPKVETVWVSIYVSTEW